MAISVTLVLTPEQESAANLGAARTGLTAQQFADQTVATVLGTMEGQELETDYVRIRNKFKNATSTQRSQVRTILAGVPATPNRPGD